MSGTSSLRRALALAAWVGCAHAATAQVTVLDPWVRGTVEGQPSTAAYLTLRSDSAVRLVSVTSPVAARCSVHEMSISGSLMRMRTIESLAIPAGGTVELREGHDHLMLEGLTHALKEGDTVQLTLTFVDSGGKRQAIDVRAPVVALGATRPGAPLRTTPMTR
jgi:copper(I)-binding protein